MSADVAEWLAFAEGLARWAIDRSGPPERQRFDTKAGPADLVTDTDRAIEQHVRDEVRRRFPGHGVFGEEFGATASEDGAPTWHVDPVDGTTNFAHGIPWSAFSVGIVANRQLVAGVVADLAGAGIVSARAGDGARLDGKPVRCADVDGLTGEVVLSEWAGNRPWPGMADMFIRLAEQDCTTRIMGSSALSLATVACGRAACAVLGRYNWWDVLGGLAAAREAGAVIMSRRGAVDPDGDVATWLPDDGLLVAAPGAAEAAWQAWVAE